MTDKPDGFLALPSSGTGRPALVLHAWWGLNDTIKSFCTRLADAGFVAFAPDLYHGEIADTITGARALGTALDSNFEQAKADIADAVEYLIESAGQSDRGIAVIGFSLGAYYALDLSVSDPDDVRAVVVFYGSWGGDYSTSRASYLGHFAEDDQFEPHADVDAMEAALVRAGRPVQFYRYAGTKHWFFEGDRGDVFDETAATLAWDRTVDFLKALPRMSE
ncbi:MAG: dienelactone hydrolase family protein [Gemmatimonadaceae bacterium]|nr:dienelactone hydrolase family protein [Gemmatimonadaceae bacterium]